MFQTKEEMSENGFVYPALQRENLISEHAALIRFHASRLATQLPATIGVDQLIDSGVIGLIEAVTRYEPSCGVEFKTYADQRIQTAMTNRLCELNPAARGISDLSIGSVSEVSCDQVEAYEQVFKYSPEPGSDESGCVLKKAELMEILTETVDNLSRVERLVVSLHYFEELTLKEIATVLRLDERRVFQVHTQAVLRLRTSLRLRRRLA